MLEARAGKEDPTRHDVTHNKQFIHELLNGVTRRIIDRKIQQKSHRSFVERKNVIANLMNCSVVKGDKLRI